LKKTKIITEPDAEPLGFAGEAKMRTLEDK